MKSIIGILVILFASFSLSTRAEIVTGRFVDANTGEPLPEVEAKMIGQPDEHSVYVHHIKPDSLGRFALSFSGNKCWVEAALIGYHPRRVSFSAYEGNDTLKLGDIVLKPSDLFLRSAVVKAKAKRFVMRGDTVVFNPAAFNLSEGARLEELIQQLPGVTEQDGKLYWMNKPVRILVNGEELFADNSILKERLPAEAVDRIKLYNKGSKLKDHTGRNDGEEDHVLDLQIKPSFLEKWYGNVEGAYQTEKGYKANLDAMFLSTTDPLMLFGNLNNINEQQFSKTFSGSSSGNSNPFGKQIFGSGGYQHKWKTRQGEKELKQQFSFNLQGQHTDGWGSKSSSRETFMAGADRTFSLSDTRNYRHYFKPDFSFHGLFQLDSLTWLTIRGASSYQKSRNRQTQRNAVYDNNPYQDTEHPLDEAFCTDNPDRWNDHLISRSLYRTTTFEEESKTSANVDLRRMLPKNSSVNLWGGISYSDVQTEVYAERDLHYRLNPQADEVRYETDRKPSHQLEATAGSGYKKWLSKQLLMQLDYNYEHKRHFDKQDHILSDTPHPADDERFDPLLDPNSYRNQQTDNIQKASLKFTFNLGNFSFMPNLSFDNQHEKLAYQRGQLDIDKSRAENLWTPDMTLRWKIKRGHSIEASYNYNTTLPTLLNTVAYTDNTDPLFIVEGNPNLRNKYAHRTALNYFANMTKHQRMVSVGLTYQQIINPFSTLYFFNSQTGAYRSMPTNARNQKSYAGNINYEQSIGNFVRVENSLKINYDRSYGFLTADYEATQCEQNFRKNFSISECPTISLERAEILLKLSGWYTINRLRYEPSSLSNQTLTVYGAALFVRYKWKDWNAETNFDLEGRKGYSSTEMNRLIPDWSLSLGRKVLHGKGNVTLNFDDLLNERCWYYVSQTATERTENRLEELHHWVQLKFSYKFDAKGDKKEKRR